MDATTIETINSSLYTIGQDPEAKLAGVDGSKNAVFLWLSAQLREWLLILDNAEYRGLFNSHGKSLLESPKHRSDPGYDMTLYSAWSLTITLLEEKASLTPSNSSFKGGISEGHMCPAVELLSLLSFFHHSSISADFFRRAAIAGAMIVVSLNNERLPSVRSDLPSQFLGAVDGSWDSRLFRQAMQGLQEQSLVQMDSVQNTWSIHPLIHFWSRERLTVEQQSRFSSETRYILVQAIANTSGKSDPGFNHQVIPHMIAFRQAIENLNLPDSYADNYASSFWHTFMTQGYFADAEVCAMRMKEGRTNHLGDRDRLTLKATETLALTIKEIGKLHESILLLQDLMKIRKLCLPENHPDVINNKILLGSLHLYRGNLQFAETTLRDAHDTAKGNLGESHELAIRAGTELGSVYISQTKFELAEPLQRDLLLRVKMKFSEAHEKTLGIMASLAATLTQIGKIQESEELKIQILQGRIASLGEEHPDTLLAQANLAATYCKQKKWKEAEEIMLQVTDKRVKLLGSVHRETLRGRVIMTTCYIGQGRFVEAIKEGEKAVKGRKATLGCDHPDTIWAMHKLAEAFECNGRVSDATNLWEECFATLRHSENLGEAHWIAKIVTGKLADAQMRSEPDYVGNGV